MAEVAAKTPLAVVLDERHVDVLLLLCDAELDEIHARGRGLVHDDEPPSDAAAVEQYADALSEAIGALVRAKERVR